MMKNSKVVVVLNNIRSNENVGSIFRTSDAAGVSKIFLCGYTPAPLDRFGRENKALAKAALGAEKFVPWQQEKNLEAAIKKLKEGGYKIVAIEQDEKAIDYTKIRDRAKVYNLALVFGNEVEGLSEGDLSLCDLSAQIPMHGKKESLNVAVAAGIVLFNIR